MIRPRELYNKAKALGVAVEETKSVLDDLPPIIKFPFE
jgi:hypothetical protein